MQNFAQANGEKTIEIAAEKSGFGNKETYQALWRAELELQPNVTG